MTPAVEHVIDEIIGSWRFRWIGLVATAILAAIGWTVVLALPDRYQAQAQIFVDTRTALKPALQGLTIDQNVDAQINLVRESLLEGPQLEKIGTESGVLPPQVTDEKQRAKILDSLQSHIYFTVSTAGNQGDDRATAGAIYTINYLDTSRSRSLLVVKTVLDTFVQRVLGGKRASSESAQKFLETQVKDYAQKLSTAEDRLAEFKRKNIGLLPSEQGGYFNQLQTEVDAEKKAETDLSIAVSRRDELSKQLHSDSAISAAGASGQVLGPGGVATGGDTLTRIQEAQAHLDELLLKFTDKHPDVISARAALQELKARRTAEMEGLRRGDANAVAASGAGSNPVYQSIQLELNKEDVEIAALRREVAQHETTVADLRKNLNSAPEVEAEFQQLNRDYDVNKAEYQSLLENYQKARLGEQADNAGSVRFEIVLPPTSSATPVWPKRKQLLFGVWLAAIAVGAGVAYLIHSIRPIVTASSVSAGIEGFPLLGVVGHAFPTSLKSQQRRAAFAFSLAGLCLLGALILMLVLNQFGVRVDIGALQALVNS